MTRYRKVECKIWTDADVAGASYGCQWLLFYMLTSPDMTALGAMRSTSENVQILSRYSGGPFKEAFAEAFQEGIVLGFWEYDECGVIWLPKFLHHNRPQSPNVVKSWHAIMETLPTCPLKSRLDAETKFFLEQHLGESFSEAFTKPFAKALRKPSGKTSAKPLPNQETGFRKQEKKEREKKKGPPNGELLSRLVTRWNEIAPSIDKPIVTLDPLPAAVLSGWARVQKSPEARRCFDDLDLLFARIRDGTFLHEGSWFCLPWLFKTKDKEWNVIKILERRFEDREHTRQNGQSRDRTFLPAGQRVGHTL